MFGSTTFSPGGLSDAELRDAVVEFERQTRVAQAGQLAAIAEIARRSDAALADDPLQQQIIRQGNHDRYRFVADEVAVELGLSKLAASHRFHFAVDLATEYPHTQQALAQGGIDLPRAREIVDQLALIQDRVFVPALEQAAVDYATTHTRPQLAAWLKRRIIATEPAAAEKRREQALADRRVAHYPGPDGVGHLWAQLDAVDSLAVWDAVNAHAARPDPSAGEYRTMDQRREDSLVELVLGKVGRGGRVSNSARPEPAEILVTVSAETLAGMSEDPAELAGYGPITAKHARELARGDARWRQVLFDGTTGELLDLAQNRAERPPEPGYRPGVALARIVKVRDGVCRFPGCRRSALKAGIDIDHVNPWPQGSTHHSNLIALCRSHHYLKTHSTWKVR